MKRNLKVYVVGIAVVSIMLNFGCNRVTAPSIHNVVPTPNPSVRMVETGSNQFAPNLFSQVAVQEQGKNFFISPLSVSMALAMTLNGAGGQTYTDMQKTLGLDGMTNNEINQSYQSLITMFNGLDPNVQFNIANSIWYRNTFQVIDTFFNVDSVYFNSEVKPLDFNASNAADIINSWVSDKTNGKIPLVISPPIDPKVVMYLINALYFNGTWKYTFDSTDTKPKPFYLMNGTSEDVQTMMVHDTLKYYYDNNFQAVELPYGDGDYSMLVLLPAYNSSFAAAEAGLDRNEINKIIIGLSTHDVQVSLPKFKIQYSTHLIPILTNLGMGIAFGPGADFTRINRDIPLVISDVLHKTYIDVNEKGTEAAAVTVVTIRALLVEDPPIPSPIDFIVNRPFLFVIKENHDNTIIFMGAVADPNIATAN